MNKWAVSWQNQQNIRCAQRRLRSVWASAQSDQSLRCPHEETLGPHLPTECTAKTLRWAQRPFCWFSHELAQMRCMDWQCVYSFDQFPATLIMYYTISLHCNTKLYERTSIHLQLAKLPTTPILDCGTLIITKYLSRDMTKPAKWLCAQRRLRSAWASAQADLSLRCGQSDQSSLCA